MEFQLNNGIKIETKGDILLLDKSLLEFYPSSMFIKIKDITGCILFEDNLIIFGEGIPVIRDMVKKGFVSNLPNCIFGEKEELKKLYEELNILLQDISNM